MGKDKDTASGVDLRKELDRIENRMLSTLKEYGRRQETWFEQQGRRAGAPSGLSSVDLLIEAGTKLAPHVLPLLDRLTPKQEQPDWKEIMVEVTETNAKWEMLGQAMGLAKSFAPVIIGKAMDKDPAEMAMAMGLMKPSQAKAVEDRRADKALAARLDKIEAMAGRIESVQQQFNDMVQQMAAQHEQPAGAPVSGGDPEAGERPEWSGESAQRPEFWEG